MSVGPAPLSLTPPAPPVPARDEPRVVVQPPTLYSPGRTAPVPSAETLDAGSARTVAGFQASSLRKRNLTMLSSVWRRAQRRKPTPVPGAGLSRSPLPDDEVRRIPSVLRILSRCRGPDIPEGMDK